MAAWLRTTAMMARSRSLCAVKRLIAGESGNCGRAGEAEIGKGEAENRNGHVVNEERWRPNPPVDRLRFLMFNNSAVNATIHNRPEEKLQQVILYFLEHINNVHLGRTKLMKLLYFVDFDHYEAHGTSVTGATYRKLPHGPYPDKIEKLIAKMEAAGRVREVKVNHKGYTQHRLITLNGKFDPAKFSGTELQTLERVAADWADATAAEIEAATHREAPWAGTQAGKEIEYEMAEYRRAIGFEPLDESLAGSQKFRDYVAALA
jgi:uncharacterized phage-associated protein